MHILADEFSRQAAMESELNIKTSLMGRPSKEQHALFQSQLNFMNLFAIPLFKRVADILPAMKYCVDELEVNKKLFEDGIAESQSPSETRQPADEGGISPKSSRPDRVALNRERQDAEHGESGMQEDLDIEPGKVLAPAAVIVENRGDRDEQPFTPAISPLSSPAATKTAHNRTAALSHQPNVEYRREVNGIVTSFDAVADFAASDPFHVNDTGSSRHHHHHHHGSSSKQRCSETTEGTGSSLPYTASGDWQSQATSATTGRMPLSPSTQATSNVSRDSIDRPRRPSSVPAPANRAKAIGLGVDRGSMIKLHAETRIESHPGGDSDGSLAVPGHEGRLVKKKSASRFLIPHFSFFKRHKGNPPPVPAADMAG